MEKEILEKYLKDGLSLNKITEITGKSLTTLVYWKNKYGLRSNHKNFKQKGTKEYGEKRFCPRCKKDCDTSEFYNRRGKENSSVYCRKCTVDQTLERTRNFKSMMVEYKGGCCIKCGYKKYIGALEFHHIDPSKKDFTLSHLKLSKFDDKIKNELDKCILVCSNCHREIHDEIVQKEKETQI
jgi:hypothetical protein